METAIYIINMWAMLFMAYYLFVVKNKVYSDHPKKEVNKNLTPPSDPPAQKKERKKRTQKTQAMNSGPAVLNSVVEHQNIKTAEIEVPVIAEDVLTYEPGELGASFPEKTRLFYSEEAISDPEYLETVMRSPLQVQTHQKNTSEANRDVDGWPVKAWFDADEKRVKIRGVLHGEDNVNYAKENKGKPGFGTSAYISFLRVEKTPGVAPNGKPYDAIVKKAVNNHIAILPNIRDPKNAIVAMNAVEDEEKKIDVSNPSWVADDSTWKKAREAAEKGNPDEFYAVATDIYKKMGGKIEHGSNSMPIDKDEFKAAMNEYEAEKKKEAEAENRIRNSIMNELKGSEEEKKKEPEKEAENAEEDEKKEEKSEAENAFPSEEMVKDFSTYLGISFPKTPTLGYLGSLVGVKETEPAALISALNAKRAEFKKPDSLSGEASNSAKSLHDAMNQFG